MGIDAARVGPPVDHVVQTEVDGHVSLYDPVTAQVHVLNRSATDTWLLSDGEHTAEEIVGLLAGAYHMDPDEVRPQVQRTVERFHEEGLLCREDGTA